MRTIGEIIKDARVKKKYSLNKLEFVTKIKKGYLEALEKENWVTLPEYPVIQGFVRNVASSLKLDKRQIAALLRRDYPPKALRINPKPDIAEKFIWSPKMTFVTGVAIVAILVLGYLGLQYFSFISPPELTLEGPKEEEVVKEREVKVFGVTDPEAVVTVNNQPALISEDGRFSVTIEIFEGTEEIVVIAKSRSGKETKISRKIKPEL